MHQQTMFDSSPAGKRRSVFFALGILTGFICFTAATSAYASTGANLGTAVALTVLGTAALLFAVTINLGGLEWLYDSA